MNRSVPAVLLALSLVLAGCNGIAFGGEETPTQTLTPVPDPTPKPTPTPVPQLAPGLTGAGVTDPFALAEAHAAVLNGTSYTVYRNNTIWYANGTIYHQFTVHVQIAANDSRFYIVRNRSTRRRSGTFSIWSNGKRVLIAKTHDNRTSYNIPRGPDTEPVPPQVMFKRYIRTSGPSIASLFSSVETRVVGSITRNGTTLYRVVATDVGNPAALIGQNSHNVTLRALISSRGLVREYRLSYTATLFNATVHIHRQFRYTDLGNTTIERPPWYDEAIENVSTTTPTG